MKKYNFVFLLIFSFCFFSLFYGCKASGTGQNNSNKTVSVRFNVNAIKSRTVLPSVDLSNYSYYLTAENSSQEKKEVASDVNLSRIGEGYDFTPDTYTFTLTAKAGANSVFQGISDEVDLTTGNASVTFLMLPITGGTGNASISLSVDEGIGVETVKFGYSDSPVTKFESAGDTEEHGMGIAVEGKHNFTYELRDKPSAVTQFVHFYFYDKYGYLLTTRTESVIIVSGATSTASISISERDLLKFTTAVTLKKNNALWRGSDYQIKLVNKEDPSCEYILDESKGVFSEDVICGSYDVYVKADGFENFEKTPLVVDQETPSQVLNYYSVNLISEKAYSFEHTGGIDVTGEDDSGAVYLVRADQELSFSVRIKTGYSSLNFAIKSGEQTISSALNDPILLSNLTEQKVITATGYTPTVYTITYHVKESDGAWAQNATKPENFTIENDVYLPTSGDFIGEGRILDGWKLSENASDAIGYIPADTIEYCRNIDLYPIFKETAYVDKTNKIIYAKGISLVIEASSSNTYVYLDLNSDGDHEDDGEIQVVSGSTKNFAGYKFRAGDNNGNAFASNITYTVKGGNIASISGFGKNSTNRSVINISGSPVIGSKTAEDENITAVDGIDLSSFTNERFYVTGALTGTYAINAVTNYDYDKKKSTYVGSMSSSLSSSVSLNNVHVYMQKEDSFYKEHKLALKNSTDGTITYVKLTSDAAIVLPDGSVESDDHITVIERDDDGSVAKFSVGEDRIQLQCSVFSISTRNGSFKLGNTVLTGGTEYMAQPTPTTYETQLKTDTSYIYLHVLSSGNELTPENASDFLEQVIFTPDMNEDGSGRKKMTLAINMESVPASEINNAQVKYFNGSFYKKSTDKKSWPNAYNAAKQTTFNGLQGYLMTITSDVENNYMYHSFGDAETWIGASRLTNKNGLDSGSFAAKDNTGEDYWFWENGPEAGIIFWGSKTWAASTSSDDYEVAKGRDISYPGYGVWDESNGDYYYQHWYNDVNIPGADVQKIHEPNNSTGENCAQYWKGNVTDDPTLFGFWNDKAQGTSLEYFIEYTPYKTQYGEQKANYQSITTSAVY